MNRYKGFSKMWFLVLLLVTVVAGCASNGAEVASGPVTLASVAVTPPLASIPVTGTQQYTVTAIFSDGSSQDVTASSTLSATNSPVGGAAVATVSSALPTNGLATAMAVGTSTITATYLGNTKTATLNVNAATATKFEVKPTSFSIPVTGTQKFTAIETFSDGTSFDRTALSIWTAVNAPLGGAAVATIGLNTGIAAGAAVGASTITATYAASPLSPATATLNVNAATSLTFKMTPEVASIPVTGTQQFTVIETFSDGSTIDRTAASVWTAGTTGVTLDVIKGKAIGATANVAPVVITAAFGGKTAIANLTVNAATSKKFEVRPSGVSPSPLVSIPVTGTQQYTAIETFSDGTNFDRTTASVWTAPDRVGGVLVATIGRSTGLATGNAVGNTSNITARFTLAGVSQTATATLNVTATSVTPSLRPRVTTTVPATTTPIPTVLSDTLITATFDKDMAPASITTLGTFTVTGPAPGTAFVQGAAIPVTYDVNTKTAAFIPAGPLDPGTYTATIKGTGINAATDLAANALAGNQVALPAASDYVWRFTVAAVIPQPVESQLGSAAAFGIMATLAITNTGPSMVNGDVSLDPGTSNGLLQSQVNGTIHINDAESAQAKADLLTAFNFYTNLAPGTTVPGGFNLGEFINGGLPGVLPPGTYTSGSTMLISTPVTLNGTATDVWVFQIGSSLTSTANVILGPGVKANNVFWVPALDATIGVGSNFSGTIVAGRDATAQTNAVINGRILAGATNPGTIALDSNTVNVPAP